MQQWEDYSVSVHQRVVDDVPFFARHQFLPKRPVLLRVMLSTVPNIPHAQKTWVLSEVRLLSQQKVHHLQLNTNKPFMLIITNFLQRILRRFILHLQCSRMSDGYRGKLVAVVKQNTFQWSLTAANEQSPIFGIVLWHSMLEQKLCNICTVHQVLHCREKTEVHLMLVAEEADASTTREEFFFLRSGCQQLGRVLWQSEVAN